MRRARAQGVGRNLLSGWGAAYGLKQPGFGKRQVVSHEVSAEGLGERPGAHAGGSGGPEMKTQGRNRKELTI